MPIAAIVTSSDETPAETSGSGTPVIGSTPITAPMFTSACTTIQAVIAVAAQPHERIADAPRDPQARVAEPAEQAHHAERPGQAKLLAEDREDEVT